MVQEEDRGEHVVAQDVPEEDAAREGDQGGARALPQGRHRLRHQGVRELLR